MLFLHVFLVLWLIDFLLFLAGSVFPLELVFAVVAAASAVVGVAVVDLSAVSCCFCCCCLLFFFFCLPDLVFSF